MNQKGFISIIVIVAVVALLGVGTYFVSTRQVTPPTPTSNPSRSPTPTPTPTPTPIPTPTPMPSPTTTPTTEPSPTLKPFTTPTTTPTSISACDGISNTVRVEFDGKPVESLKMVTGGQDTYETMERQGFNLMASANTDQIEKVIFVVASRLSHDQQNPTQVLFNIGYREYEKSTLPYTQRVNFSPQTMTGQVETRAVATNWGERVCGFFDVVGTGIYTIHVVGSFNQVFPFPRTGSQ